jgi:amidase
MDPAEITDLRACELSEAIHQRRLSCREVMQAYLARIESLNPQVNALVSLQPADALLAQADARDAQLARGPALGWMHGFPMAIKDLSAAAGRQPRPRFVPQREGQLAGDHIY